MVEQFLESQAGSAGCALRIVDESTAEYDFGWVFFYNSAEFLDSGDWRHALAGNGLLFVDRKTGSIEPAGTAEPIEYYVENYRRHGSPHPPQ